MTTPPDLTTLDALYAAATPGPWEFSGIELSSPGEPNPTHGQLEANAALIASLVNAFPALSARIRELEAENAYLRKIADVIDSDESAAMAKLLDAPPRVIPALRELLRKTYVPIEVDGKDARIELLEETLRGIRQEKLEELDMSNAITRREHLTNQIAWIDRVLRGEP
jgi:hypothetical protein